ncbi:MAG: MYXO-CTERM sorting domain-containing protein [Planctomycetota bacterium]
MLSPPDTWIDLSPPKWPPPDTWIDLSPPKWPLPGSSHTGQNGPPDDDRLSAPPVMMDPFLDTIIKLPGGDLLDDPLQFLSPPAGGGVELPLDAGPPRADLVGGEHGGGIDFTPPAGTIPAPGAIPLLAAAALWQRHRRRRCRRRQST